MSDTYFGIPIDPISRLTNRIQDAAGWARSMAIQTEPRLGVEGVDFSGDSLPAADFGRDFFDFVPIPGGELTAWIGNASGHGAGAGILMSGMQAFLRRLTVETEGDLQRVVAAINRTVCEVCPESFYAPLFCGQIDPRRRELHYVNAGHEAALLLRRRTGRAHRLEGTGPVLGLTGRAVYGRRSFPLEPGDVMVAFSEGVCASTGLAGVAELVRERIDQSSMDLVHEILMASDKRPGESDDAEDRTVVAMRLIGVKGEPVRKRHEAVMAFAA